MKGAVHARGEHFAKCCLAAAFKTKENEIHTKSSIEAPRARKSWAKEGIGLRDAFDAFDFGLSFAPRAAIESDMAIRWSCQEESCAPFRWRVRDDEAIGLLFDRGAHFPKLCGHGVETVGLFFAGDRSVDDLGLAFGKTADDREDRCGVDEVIDVDALSFQLAVFADDERFFGVVDVDLCPHLHEDLDHFFIALAVVHVDVSRVSIPSW